MKNNKIQKKEKFSKSKGEKRKPYYFTLNIGA